MHFQTTLIYLIYAVFLVAQSLAAPVLGCNGSCSTTDAVVQQPKQLVAKSPTPTPVQKPAGEYGRMPFSKNPKRELFFEYSTKPAVSMDSVEDVFPKLDEVNVDFLHMKLSKAVSEAMDERDYDTVQNLLKAAYLPDEKYEVKLEDHLQVSTTAGGRTSGNFHSDGNRKFASYDGVLNFWIPTKKVMGRPLAFVKSSSLSDSQKITNAVHPTNYLKYDEAHEYIFVPDMKGPGGKSGDDKKESGDMLVFQSSNVYHGSPVLYEHQGDRDAMVFLFMFKRK
jgi:hypothetical protein